MLITRTSIATNITRTVEIDVTQAQIDAWVDGQLIQHAMPNLTDNEREFIMTGCSGDEWDQLMLEEEDDGYDHEDDYDEYDYDDDCRSSSDKETHDRLDMGRNEAGEWLGFM